MPELPEVRALSERLDALVAGARVVRVTVPGFSGLKTVEPSPSSLVGAVVERVTSKGKYLVIGLGGHGTALVHLGNAGRVDVERPVKATRPRGSLVRVEFDALGLLVREHGTERRAGLWILAPGDAGPVAALGPEPFEEGFAALVATSNDTRHLHTFLRDQRTVAGIGRGYADDLMHRARLSPYAALGKLVPEERDRLHRATLEVLTEALERERRRTGGLSDAKLGDRFVIHRRAGAPCPSCGRRLERVSFESYEIVYCPDCQTRGKVLADRRLSRLLR